jgi:hypothetical protein
MSMPSELTESSETERIIKALRRFTPRHSVRILADENDELAFLKTWALARLLSWAMLDQRPGKRRRKPTSREPVTPQGQSIRTRSARHVGHLTLASLVDRRIQRHGAKKGDGTLELMLSLFTITGGFGSLVQCRGAQGLLAAAKRTNRELGYVYRIVLFLCRYKKHISDPAKFDIETAKHFVAKNMHDGDRTYGLSKISKIWEKYKQAAPYIFALYPYFSAALERTNSPSEVVDFLEKLSSNQQRLARIIGRAAYAADILEDRARGVRLRDFKQIARVEPPLPRFQAVELTVVDIIDRHAAIP